MDGPVLLGVIRCYWLLGHGLPLGYQIVCLCKLFCDQSAFFWGDEDSPLWR